MSRDPAESRDSVCLTRSRDRQRLCLSLVGLVSSHQCLCLSLVGLDPPEQTETLSVSARDPPETDQRHCLSHETTRETETRVCSRDPPETDRDSMTAVIETCHSGGTEQRHRVSVCSGDPPEQTSRLCLSHETHVRQTDDMMSVFGDPRETDRDMMTAHMGLERQSSCLCLSQVGLVSTSCL